MSATCSSNLVIMDIIGMRSLMAVLAYHRPLWTQRRHGGTTFNTDSGRRCSKHTSKIRSGAILGSFSSILDKLLEAFIVDVVRRPFRDLVTG
jgi:hypothetical protein